MTYCVLLNPSHNRIYFDSTKELACAELAVLLSKSDLQANNIRNQKLQGLTIYYSTAIWIKRNCFTHYSTIIHVFLPV